MSNVKDNFELLEREKKIYGNDAKIVFRDDDCTIYRIANGGEEVLMTCYKVFEGIELIYNDVHMEYCSIGKEKIGNVIEINHCREGRIECEFENEFCYLSEGDMALTRKNDAGHNSYFPTKHYHGVSIMIDVEAAKKSISCIMEDVDINLEELMNKYCNPAQTFIMRSNPTLEHIFSELYRVPCSIRKGYFKVKVLELLLFLSGMKPEKSRITHFYSKSQVSLAKNICKYLSDNMSEHITTGKLAKEFHVSETHIRNCFKGVYGESVYAFIKKEKMKAAALVLSNSDETILSIAGRFGYDNGSKFASAFESIIGMSPKEYRNRSAVLEP